MKTSKHLDWRIAADGQNCPFCNSTMSFEFVQQTQDEDGPVTYCGRNSCLRKEAKRRGIRVPRKLHLRHERRLRNRNYHSKEIDQRAGDLTVKLSPTGHFIS